MVTTSYLERDVPANGLKLHYQEWGSPSAPPVIMLHGFGVSGHMFDEFAERMQDATTSSRSTSAATAIAIGPQTATTPANRSSTTSKRSARHSTSSASSSSATAWAA